MIPVIALVGRPNVGKSTLFNRLTRTRDALVADVPGLMAQQAWQAVNEADCVFFLVDGREGLTGHDETIAAALRRTGKPHTLVVNKIDGIDADSAVVEFYALGLGDPVPISASHGRGVDQLLMKTFAGLPPVGKVEAEAGADSAIRVAVAGRPNVGKSTLINRMLGEERVLAYDQPGTTRDSIFIPFRRDGVDYTLIDTAGVRRKARVQEVIEKFSVIKTLQAIDAANVVILVLDAQSGISEQDATLAGYIAEKGRALIIAVNKWDGLDAHDRAAVKKQLELKLPFLDFASTLFISALHGTAVGDLFVEVNRAHASAMRDLPTPELTDILERAVQAHPPPMVRGRRIKLRYAHQGGRNPPVIVIHGNQTERVPEAYRRYLVNAFRAALRVSGTPIRIVFRGSGNPYQGVRNRLTARQASRRRRLTRHARGRR
jgi:GTP-binding protein